LTNKTMTPLTIQEILELPIGSKVVVERMNTVHLPVINCRVSEVNEEGIELDCEVVNGAHHFHSICINKTSTGNVIYDRFTDVSEQVFLDESGVDRVYSDEATFEFNKNREKFSMIKLKPLESLSNWHPGQKIQVTYDFLAVLNARLKS
jgi:hypothetical protein